MKTENIGLYVHIPFCLKKCNYCDFCSYSDLNKCQREGYISSLLREIDSYKCEEKIGVDTVFFGGGTPSLLTSEEFTLICEKIKNTFSVSDNVEFTVEANPKTLTEEKLRTYVSCGVNRISIGMQTIHENERKILGRIHSFEDFKISYQLALKSGIKNVNVDVMYGIPEQTLESFKETLNAVVTLNPAHISAYGLILEEGTNFWKTKHNLDLPGEETECVMYDFLCEFLSSHGYKHYEISNFSKPGYESLHNLKYWRNQKYIGVGISAYSYFNSKRYGNTLKFSEYLSETSAKYSSCEVIDKDAEAYEYAMLRLRLAEGISLSEYKKQFGKDFLYGKEEKINAYIKSGYVKFSNDRIALTEKGFYVSNAILTELL